MENKASIGDAVRVADLLGRRVNIPKPALHLFITSLVSLRELLRQQYLIFWLSRKLIFFKMLWYNLIVNNF